MSEKDLPIKMATLNGSYYGAGTIYYIDDPKLFCIEPLRQGSFENAPINKWCRTILDTQESSLNISPYAVNIVYYYYRGLPIYNPKGPAIQLTNLTVYTNSKGQIHNLNGPALSEQDYNGKISEEYYIDGRDLSSPRNLIYYLLSTGKQDIIQQFLFSDNVFLRDLAKEAIEEVK